MTRLVPVPCPAGIRTRLDAMRGLPRVLFERAVLAAVRREEAKVKARERAEASRYRKLFGWSWT